MTGAPVLAIERGAAVWWPRPCVKLQARPRWRPCWWSAAYGIHPHSSFAFMPEKTLSLFLNGEIFACKLTELRIISRKRIYLT